MTDTMTLSLSELRGLIAKAARGAGLSWGLAEEAGWAAEWLARRGMPAADWATLWLAARVDQALSPVEVGVRMADDPANGLGPNGTALPDGLTAPGYLLPFLHRIAETRAPLAITSERGPVALVTPDGQVEFGPCWLPQSSGWTVGKVDGATGWRDPTCRPTVSRATLVRLDAIALRTTVPPSDASRRDAGSSTGDND